MDYLKSTQSFVRALKTSADPPIAGGPIKIDIARNAWDAHTFVVPKKGEVILEWIFSKFAKEKNNPATLADTRYWHLVQDIISSSSSTSKSSSSKLWSPFFGKIAFAPLLIACMEVLGGLDAQHAENVANAFAPCFNVVWPLSVQKMSSEALLDCFGAYLHLNAVLSRHASFADTPWPSVREIGAALTSAYRTSVQNASNKKKLCMAFLSQHFTNWVSCISTVDDGTSTRDIYAAGVETCFNFDSIRHSASADGLLATFEGTLANNTEALMGVVPRICASLIDSSRKHKAAIVQSSGSGDPAAHLRRFAYSFIASCLGFMARMDQSTYTWSARNKLLDLVDKMHLFHYQDSVAHPVLVDEVERALATLLEKSKPDYHSAALEAFTTLVQIEFDIVLPVIPRLLPIVAFTKPDQTPQSMPLLQRFLEYYSKTRDLPRYILQLFDVFQHLSLPDATTDIYRAGFSGPILSIDHLNQVARSICAFSSSAQISELADMTVATLERQLNLFLSHDSKLAADIGEGARKKRRTSKNVLASGGEQDSNTLVHSLAFAMRLAGVVITAVATKANSDGLEKLKGDVIRLNEDTLRPALLSGLKAISKNRRLGAEEWQIALTSLVQFQSTLAIDACLRLGDDEKDRKLYSQLLEHISDGHAAQELTIVTLQFLLRLLANGIVESPADVLDSVLKCLEQIPVDGGGWSGYTFELSESQGTGAALLYILLRRWLNDFEAFASTSQLERLATSIISFSLTSYPAPAKQTTADSLFMLLRSADFWEMNKLREAITILITTRTAFLDDFNLETLLDGIGKQKQMFHLPSSHHFAGLKPILNFLHHSPLEYLPRTVHAELYRRFAAADVLINGYTEQMERSQRVIISTLARSFLLRKPQEQTSSLSFVKYLTDDETRSASLVQQSVTQNLLRAQLSSLLQSSKSDTDLCAIIKYFTSMDVARALENSSSILDNLQIFIDLIIVNFEISTLSAKVVELLQELSSQLLLSIQPTVEAIVRSPDLTKKTLTILRLWKQTLAFGRWISLDLQISALGTRLVSAFFAQIKATLPSADLAELKKVLFSVVNEERRCRLTVGDDSGLEIMLACYIILVRPDNAAELDDASTKVWRSLSVSEFMNALEILHEDMGGNNSNPEHLVKLVHTSSTLIHNSPEGTLKITQGYFSRCLFLFVNHYGVWMEDSSLRLEILRFLAAYCTQRPASLRPMDMSNLLTVVERALSGSKNHDSNTSRPTFHALVAILAALVRMRRDLLSPVLPHFSYILRRLFTAFRQPRMQLGAKQTQVVAELVPAWISFGDEGLGIAEARAFARLLTNIIIKTTVRTFTVAPTGSEESTGSLARPFSKHAAPVLKAYVDAMNDPLSAIATEVRKELQPGLFALCEMTSEHSRDALVASSLDAGGKVILKSLWKDWEKQRYVGKG